MSQVQARAARRKHANGYAHLPPKQRPGYTRRDAGTSAARLQAKIEKERQMQQRSKKR